MDRYVFVVQFYCKDSSKTVDTVVGVKLYLSKTSVNSDEVFHTIIVEVCGGILGKIYSVMSDTCRMNTGKKTGINKRLRDYLDDNFEHDVHSLGCMFHINETYLSLVIDEVEGKSKGPNALEEAALLNKRFSADFDCQRSSRYAHYSNPKLHLRSKINWFSEQKNMGNITDGGFRSDQMCSLVLPCQLFVDIPANLKSLLWCKQEKIGHPAG